MISSIACSSEANAAASSSKSSAATPSKGSAAGAAVVSSVLASVSESADVSGTSAEALGVPEGSPRLRLKPDKTAYNALESTQHFEVREEVHTLTTRFNTWAKHRTRVRTLLMPPRFDSSSETNVSLLDALSAVTAKICRRQSFMSTEKNPELRKHTFLSIPKSSNVFWSCWAR